MNECAPTRTLAAPAEDTAGQPRPAISVIIPALNEGDRIGDALARLPRGPEIEVIVVDGGSHDRTAALAQAAGVRVLRTPPGRALQMNAGAAMARGEILLFLHADTFLPEGFLRQARETLGAPQVIAGTFRLKIDSPRRGLRWIERLANFRSVCLQS